jgi:hypothetical protein
MDKQVASQAQIDTASLLTELRTCELQASVSAGLLEARIARSAEL